MGEHLKLAGSWNAVSNTNFEEILSKIEIPSMVRNSAALMKPKHIISFEENKMKVVTVGRRTKEQLIPLDRSEHSDEIFGKKFVGSAAANDDGSITVTGKLGDMDMETVRKIDGDGQMILTITIDDVECIRVFVRESS